MDETTPYTDTTSPFSMRRRRTHDDPFDDGPFREATEILEMSCHMATHVEALCAVAEVENDVPVLYGGTPSADGQVGAGFGGLGIDHCPPIISRGMLLDLPACLGIDVLPDSYGITEEDLEDCLSSSDLEIRPADTVLIRTGFSRIHEEDRARFLTVGPGPTPAACPWPGERRIGPTGSDTMSFEQVPSLHLGHLELIRGRGISISKHLNLEALARDGVHEFHLIVCHSGSSGQQLRQ